MANSTSGGKTTIDSLGYHFCKESVGKQEFTVLRNKTTNEKFKYGVYGDESKNQQRYEELGEAVKNHVQDICLAGNLKLLKIEIPVDAKTGEAKGFFFMSEYALYFKKLIIFVHGSGVVPAGVWSRRIVINENLESGTVIPYVERALKEGFGVIVTNGNYNKDSKNRPIKGSESAQDHFVYVWNNYIKDAKTKPDIFIVAHSFGGQVVLHGLRNIDQAMKRIRAVAFTHSTHSTANESLEVKKWLKERARDWVCSEEQLDSPVNMNREDDCDQVSAGTMEHTMTPYFAKDSIFSFFEKKLPAEGNSNFVKPTQLSEIAQKYRPDKQDVYKMTSSCRGLAVIVNMNNFQAKAKVSDREGSEVDVEGLRNLFEGLDFMPKTLIDLTKDKLLDEFREITSYHLKAYDCLVVCIMSHGYKDHFIASDGEKIEIQTIQKMFDNKNCKTLCGKPKLFFINACRGPDVDVGTVVEESCYQERKPSSEPKNSSKVDDQHETTAENADMFTAFSSVEGYVSHRDTKEGSWFFRHLINVFKEYAGTDNVDSLLTKVTNQVNSEGKLEKKQVSQKVSHLTKEVFFWPGMKFEYC